MIHSAREGDKEARDSLFDIVYEEMRRIASKSRGAGAFGHTMQPTALANEAYLFLEKRFPLPPTDQPEDRSMFFRTVALAMRAILKDYWRKKRAAKRGGGDTPLAIEHDLTDRAVEGTDFEAVDFLDLDEAMDRLEKRNGRWFTVVMHKYYAGRTVPEIAQLMDVSQETVKKDWHLARAWLLRELEQKDQG
jgi:RNA polymerase sigma factor (TIGR02999 family)